MSRRWSLLLVLAAALAAMAVARADPADVTPELLRRATLELGQRVRPSEVDHRWAIEPPRRDVAREAAAAEAEGRLADWTAALSPPWPRYRALQALRARYAAYVAEGGWSSLPGGANLAQGDSGAAVGALRSRLAAEGYAAGAGGPLFDEPLRQALVAFQRGHALAPDGVLGPQSRAALDVPPARRLAQIDANLERWRWLPRDLPPDRLEVDVGGPDATLYRADRPVLEMRVIVGDPRHQTPMFASRIESVVFNPPWNVPASIARNEILPRLKRDPGYLARNNFTLSDGRLVQHPGPRNALGQVKFDLPSPFGVYLHDTPGKAAFALPVRTLSHGCMRLEKPRELALALLAPQGGTAESVEAQIAAGRTSRVALRRPTPLYVLYWTVVVGEDGEPVFRRDPYGWDAKLTAALAGTTGQPVAFGPVATDCSGAARPS